MAFVVGEIIAKIEAQAQGFFKVIEKVEKKLEELETKKFTIKADIAKEVFDIVKVTKAIEFLNNMTLRIEKRVVKFLIKIGVLLDITQNRLTKIAQYIPMTLIQKKAKETEKMLVAIIAGTTSLISVLMIFPSVLFWSERQVKNLFSYVVMGVITTLSYLNIINTKINNLFGFVFNAFKTSDYLMRMLFMEATTLGALFLVKTVFGLFKGMYAGQKQAVTMLEKIKQLISFIYDSIARLHVTIKGVIFYISSVGLASITAFFVPFLRIPLIINSITRTSRILKDMLYMRKLQVLAAFGSTKAAMTITIREAIINFTKLLKHIKIFVSTLDRAKKIADKNLGGKLFAGIKLPMFLQIKQFFNEAKTYFACFLTAITRIGILIESLFILIYKQLSTSGITADKVLANIDSHVDNSKNKMANTIDSINIKMSKTFKKTTFWGKFLSLPKIDDFIILRGIKKTIGVIGGILSVFRHKQKELIPDIGSIRKTMLSKKPIEKAIKKPIEKKEIIDKKQKQLTEKAMYRMVKVAIITSNIINNKYKIIIATINRISKSMLVLNNISLNITRSMLRDIEKLNNRYQNLTATIHKVSTSVINLGQKTKEPAMALAKVSSGMTGYRKEQLPVKFTPKATLLPITAQATINIKKFLDTMNLIPVSTIKVQEKLIVTKDVALLLLLQIINLDKILKGLSQKSKSFRILPIDLRKRILVLIKDIAYIVKIGKKGFATLSQSGKLAIVGILKGFLDLNKRAKTLDSSIAKLNSKMRKLFRSKINIRKMDTDKIQKLFKKFNKILGTTGKEGGYKFVKMLGDAIKSGASQEQLKQATKVLVEIIAGFLPRSLPLWGPLKKLIIMGLKIPYYLGKGIWKGGKKLFSIVKKLMSKITSYFDIDIKGMFTLDFLKDLTKKSTNFIRTSKKLGIATNRIQGLAFATEHYGATMGDLSFVLMNLNNKIRELSNPVSETTKTFEKLGIDIKKIKTSTEPALIAMYLLSDKLKVVRNDSMEAKKVIEALGAIETSNLMLMFRDGSEEIKNLMSEAARLGIILDKEMLNKARKISIVNNRIKTTFEGIGIEIRSNILPLLLKLNKKILTFLKKNRQQISIIILYFGRIFKFIIIQIGKIFVLSVKSPSIALNKFLVIIKIFAKIIFALISKLLELVGIELDKFTDKFIDKMKMETMYQLGLFLLNIWNYIYKKISGYTGFLWFWIKTGFNFLYDSFASVIEDIINYISLITGEMWTALKSGLSGFWTYVKNTGKNAINFLLAFLFSIINSSIVVINKLLAKVGAKKRISLFTQPKLELEKTDKAIEDQWEKLKKISKERKLDSKDLIESYRKDIKTLETLIDNITKVIITTTNKAKKEIYIEKVIKVQMEILNLQGKINNVLEKEKNKKEKLLKIEKEIKKVQSKVIKKEEIIVKKKPNELTAPTAFKKFFKDLKLDIPSIKSDMAGIFDKKTIKEFMKLLDFKGVSKEVAAKYKKTLEEMNKIPKKVGDDGETVITYLTELGKKNIGFVIDSLFDGMKRFLNKGKLTLQDLSKIGKTMFDNALGEIINIIKPKLQTAIEGFASMLGATGKIGGMAIAGITAIAGFLLSKIKNQVDVVHKGIENTIEKSEQLRGVIAGETQIGILEISNRLALINRPLVYELQGIRGLIREIRDILLHTNTYLTEY